MPMSRTERRALAIIDVLKPQAPRLYRMETFGGQMDDVQDVIVGSTNASLFAYVRGRQEWPSRWFS